MQKQRKIDPPCISKDVRPGLKPQRISTPYLKDYGCAFENIYFHRLYYEPFTQKVLRLCIVTPGVDDTVTGATGYKMFYQISDDDGKTFSAAVPLVQKGSEFNERHPIRPVYIPENAYSSSHSAPVRATNGEIMCPFEFRALDGRGKCRECAYHPIFENAGVLIGRWTDSGNDIEWDLGQTLDISPETSTRGLFEPALIELRNDGHFLMVMRGSNVNRPDLPSYKWMSVSEDYCRTWTSPIPFSYVTGERFFSPSSCSDFRRSTKTGKIYWFGNITPKNGNGNDLRYPLVIAELDEERHAIIRDSVTVIDTRRKEAGDSDKVQFSNFNIIEEPDTNDFMVSLRIYDFVRHPTRGKHYADNPGLYSRPGLYRIKLDAHGCSASGNLSENSNKKDV